MARVVDTALTSYELNPREQAEGCQLNINQRMVIQNRLALYAVEKLTWIYDPDKHMYCIQREAELQGQIRLLQMILEDATQAEETLLDMARNPAKYL